jgi:hypothetical protein
MAICSPSIICPTFPPAPPMRCADWRAAAVCDPATLYRRR